MSAPERVFVAYGRRGASTVSEYRDEAEAQHGTIATEYVTEASAAHAAEISSRIQARMHAGLEQLIVEKDAALAELTRLRAALAKIAARHTPSPDDDTPASGPSESLRGAYGQGFDASTFVAAEMARKALVTP